MPNLTQNTIQRGTDTVNDNFSVMTDGVSAFSRKLVYYGGPDSSIVDCSKDASFPKIGSVHPNYTNYTLDSIDGRISGTVPYKTYEFELKYKRSSAEYGSRDDSGDSSGTEPWNLGIQNFRKTPVEDKTSMTEAYTKTISDGAASYTMKPLLNSAGCQIVAERSRTVFQITFDYYTRLEIKSPDREILNNRQILINGRPYRKYSVIMSPFASEEMRVTDENGKMKYRYWANHIVLRYNPEGYETPILNVGTMALFGEAGKRTLGNIFKYWPWVTKNESSNMKVAPAYGGISDVINAKNNYVKATKNEEVPGKFSEIPWEQVTEPMPLRDDGTLYTEAIYATPDNRPEYRKIYILPCIPTSFDQFSIPFS